MKRLSKRAWKGEFEITTSTVLGDTEFNGPCGENVSYVQHVRDTDEERLVASPGGLYGNSIQVHEEVTVERSARLSG